MTEEEARPENTSPEVSQPDKKLDSQKSLTDKNSVFPTGTFKFQQTKEQKTMTDAANKPKSTQLGAEAISDQRCKTPSKLPKILMDPEPAKPEQAKTEFNGIKKALVGPQPEWCLPEVDPKASKTTPEIDNTVLTHSCNPHKNHDSGYGD
jgi:hypothetical protein